jgi:hypothetical protein
MKISYNSVRPDLALPEYGRNIHNMVQHAMTLADREERNRCVRAIIATMGNLFPMLRDTEDYRHKLWDHIFIMSDFRLDVDSPYPRPSRESFEEKPKKVPYPQGNIRFGHYGKTIERIIHDASLEEDDALRAKIALSVGNLMKRTYVQWNANGVRDEVIASDLKLLSKGRLIIENPEELTPTAQVVQMASSSVHPSQSTAQGGKNRKNKKSKKKRR